MALETRVVNALAHPLRANIFDLIVEGNVTFRELCEKTGMSNDGVSKHLKQLFESYLVKVEINNEEGRYAKYVLTDRGQQIHDAWNRFSKEITTMPKIKDTNMFAMDDETFWKIKDGGLPRLRKLFAGSKIVFTNSEFAKLLEKNEDTEDEEIEEFLCSDLVTVPATYMDIKKGIMYEFYLRRSKKLSAYEANIVAMAIDLDAGIISDNPKIISGAMSLGIMTIGSKAISLMDDHMPMHEQFSELACNPASAAV